MMGMDFTATLVSTDLINHFALAFTSRSQIFFPLTSHYILSSYFSNNVFSTSLIIMDNTNTNDGNGASAPDAERDNRNPVIEAFRGHLHRRRKHLSVLEHGDNMFMEHTRRVNHGGDFAAAARVQHARDVCCCCRCFCCLDFTCKHAVLDQFWPCFVAVTSSSFMVPWWCCGESHSCWATSEFDADLS